MRAARAALAEALVAQGEHHDGGEGCRGVRLSSDGNSSSVQSSSSFYSTLQRAPSEPRSLGASSRPRASNTSNSSSAAGGMSLPRSTRSSRLPAVTLSPPPANEGSVSEKPAVSEGRNSAHMSSVGGAIQEQTSDASGVFSPISSNHSDAPAVEDVQSPLLPSAPDVSDRRTPLDPTPPLRDTVGAAVGACDKHELAPQPLRSCDAAGSANRPSSNGVRRSLGVPSPSFRKESVV